MEQIGMQQSKEKEKERERGTALYTRHVKKETWNLFTRS